MPLHIVRLAPAQHDRAGFDCGEPSLNRYLREQAGQHQRDGIATTHVLADDGAPGDILGYLTLAAAQMDLLDLQPADRKRLPNYPVPAVRLARLAVARAAQGHDHGRLLVGHALNVSLQLRAALGVNVLLVDALNARAAAFYQRYGFRETLDHALTLYLPLGKP